MLKHLGDLIEKLVAGSLVIGLFSSNTPALAVGLTLTIIWLIIRFKEVRGRRAEK